MLQSRSSVAAFSAAAALVLSVTIVAAFMDRSSGDPYTGPEELKAPSMKLPAALRKAQQAAGAVSTHAKQARIKQEAKIAMKKYKVVRKRAKDAMVQENHQVKSLVSNAAKELIAEEAARKTRSTEDPFNPMARPHRKLSPGQKWTQKMRDAENAALDVINKQDKTVSEDQEHWNQYAKKTLKKIKEDKHNLNHAKSIQQKHIHKLIREGKIKATTPWAQAKARRKAKELARAKAQAARTITLEKKRRKELKAARKRQAEVNKIAKKDLPKFEHHIASQQNQLKFKKQWREEQNSAKVMQTSRDKKWAAMVKAARSHQKSDRAKRLKMLAERAKRLKRIKAAENARENKHLQKQIDSIISPADVKAREKDDAKARASIASAKFKRMQKKLSS